MITFKTMKLDKMNWTGEKVLVEVGSDQIRMTEETGEVILVDYIKEHDDIFEEDRYTFDFKEEVMKVTVTGESDDWFVESDVHHHTSESHDPIIGMVGYYFNI